MSRNAVVTLTGKKGSGKTTKVRAVVRRSRRLIVVDPEMRWEPQHGDRVIYGGRELVSECRRLGLANPSRRFRFVYRDRNLDLMKVAGPGAAYVVGDVTLCIDELAWVCDARRLPERLRWLLQFGRHHRVNLIGTTREPQEIHNMFFAQADLVYLFHTDPGNGLDRLRRWYPELADDLPGLAVGKFRTYGNLDILPVFGREGLDRSADAPPPSSRTRKRRRV